MSRHKKSTADVSGIGGGGNVGTVSNTSIPIANYYTKGDNRNQGLFSILPQGEEYALTARELAQIANCTPREITRAINRARLDGAPICACGRGFYFAVTLDELTRYCRAFNRRLRSMRATQEALTDTMNAVTGQQSIGEKGGGTV